MRMSFVRAFQAELKHHNLGDVAAMLTYYVVLAVFVVALGALAVGPALGSYLAGKLGLGAAFAVAWTIGRWVLAAVMVMLIWSLLYRFLPDTDRRFPFLSVGAVVGVIIWIGASLLFALYVANFGKYEKTYGALGAVIIFLVWTWISNLALLVGAEVNLLRSARRGARRARAPVPGAEWVPGEPTRA